ncbi:DNA starvation/stationary phase protection protein [Roseomonas sp. HJA6]|uniref:DNA starvation/stationary phase protection protein n=1 Tax=Roseomonas alba TaxID=2846776 RepID=A0ABS7A3M9_9PROT|nr:DNA starvation/stationary phase protection protein [Neoroseomonas alba]MBW6396901.1 DNA starvation/stationary phase protection protein [Neoroseomonas alba]
MTAPLATQSRFPAAAVTEPSLATMLADMLALYAKTENFHWHLSGTHFRDCHLMLDDRAAQIFATTDRITERARKIGGTTLRSIGHAVRIARIADNDAEYVAPLDMLAELRDDNRQLAVYRAETHALSDRHGDVATASLPEARIDEAEGRAWFLFEASRRGEAGH